MAHYAVAAALLAAFGLRRRELALGALWAVIPDLDVATAIPWTLAAPQLPLSADALVTGAYLFGHRGLSHTLLAAALAAAVAWAWTRQARWGLFAGLVWASHVVLDAVSPWPTTPYWPLSDATVHAPIVTGLDPIMTVASLAAIAALAAPFVAGRWESLGEARADRWRRFGHRWGHRFAYATLGAVLLNVAWLGAVAAGSGTSFSNTYSANVPRTVTVVPDGDAYEVGLRWSPWDAPETQRIPMAANRTQGLPGAEAIEQARCMLPGLGPYATVDKPVWIARPGREGVTVEAVDLLRNATSSGGPRLAFTFDDGRIERVATTGGNGDEGWFSVGVPQPVVEAARCR